eukprot:225223-Chlamydomonas_euryale.AAC.1
MSALPAASKDVLEHLFSPPLPRAGVASLSMPRPASRTSLHGRRSTASNRPHSSCRKSRARLLMLRS